MILIERFFLRFLKGVWVGVILVFESVPELELLKWLPKIKKSLRKI